MNELSFSFAFLAGFMSFFSPCVLPLVPAYISFITGVSLENLKSSSRHHIFISTLSFVCGFSTIFITLGASSSLIGSLLTEYQNFIRIVGGILIILFGLFVMDLFKLKILLRERRYYFQKGPTNYLGAFIVGVSFAAGWTPCIGPILGTILIYVSSQASTTFGVQLLFLYSLGLAIPFLVSALGINLFFNYTRKLHKFMQLISVLSGLILISFGILLLTDKLGILYNLFLQLNISP
ncbi:MAG: cytochrome c biogenesis protein CcdA [Thermodesulfovibrionales bacterium]|nr:cytochrome c biogenesis protein CcdA [Thermodesulfovibrionales bacterium]